MTEPIPLIEAIADEPDLSLRGDALGTITTTVAALETALDGARLRARAEGRAEERERITAILRDGIEHYDEDDADAADALRWALRAIGRET